MAIGFTHHRGEMGHSHDEAACASCRVQLNSGEAQFNIALVCSSHLSVLAIYAGVAAIIGAFLAGMALAESVNQRVTISHTASPNC